MMKKLKKLFLFGAASAMLGATPAMAQIWTDYDIDSDGYITRDEYYGWVSDAGVYADWDYNNDGLLDENEFNSVGTDWDFGYWDTDDDAYLDSGEFYDGYYTAYDSNEDGHWQNGEWDDAYESGLFDF